MSNSFWINLPVTDLARSREFFRQLDFTFNDQHGLAGMVSMVVGTPPVIVNLFPEAAFAGMAGNVASDALHFAEVILSIGADSREEVNELTEKARQAGGVVYGEPAEVQGWMYASGFRDLDGHRWSLLHMDMSRMRKG
ncbi:glyoxalase [soil metagenome]